MGPAHCCEHGAVSANEKYRQAADPEGKARGETEAAVHRLVQQNEETIRRATYFSSEVGELEAQQQRACDSVAAKLETSFSPEVLDTLKGNADQLFQLKQEVVAENKVAKEHAKKMMFWMSGGGGGEQQGSSNAAAGQMPGSDAVKQRGFRPLQLPGSSLAAVQTPQTGNSSSTWKALKFWQIGTNNSKQVARQAPPAADNQGVADQQPQKSLSSMLFGKHKRHSSGGADGAQKHMAIDPAASWRSSVDGSFNGRRSTRSSDAGAAMVAAAAAAAAAAGSGGVMSSLAAGEGPLSKSHSMLATKPGTQQEQILGKSLEIVAEDEREGRDSPAPAELPGRRLGHPAGQSMGLAPIRVPRAGGNRSGSPGDSFSFGNRPEEEQSHSPSFLRASVSSRAAQQGGSMAGPLVRSSLALRASMVARVDPFEALEPEAQPFVEQLREGDGSAGGAGAQGGIMAALRRSISGAGAGSSSSSRTPRQSGEGTAWAAAVGGAGAPQVLMQRQQGHAGYTQAGFTQQQQQQQVSEGGASMQFLDLDATRAYALGVHQVMLKLEQGMQSLHSQSEASSRPTTPRGSAFADAAGAAAEGSAAAAAAQQEAEGLNTCRSRAQLHSAEQSPAKPAGEEQQQEASDGEEQELQQQQQSARGRTTGDGSPAEEGPLGAARAAPLRVEASDAGGMPPLRSGMSSPAASRRQTLVSMGPGGASAASRQLPLMGQASMEILERRPQQLGASRQTSLVGSSTAVSLAEVYKQTSGNLAPLSSHLSGIGRRSSSTATKGIPPAAPNAGLGLSSRGPSGALATSNSRSILGEAGPQAGALAGGGLGPLSMQYGSTMTQAKKSAHAAGLAAGTAQPDQRQAQAAAWAADAAAAAAGGGDAAAAAAAASAFAANNKYASSWGILDAGGLSRQGSVNGQQSMSRLPSGGAPLTRQGSGSQRTSPRASGTDDGTWQQQQQQRLRGAAGRYAGTSLTPASLSPRSGTATPAREDSMSGQQFGPAGRRRVAAGAGAGALSASMRQAEQGAAAGRGAAAAAGGPRDGSTAGSDDYESAEEQLSSNASASGGYTGLSGSYGSGAPVTVPSTRGPSSTAAGGSGALPNPPAFLSNRPTSAQAAVATQWSPSKNPAAYAQAPAYMRDAVMRISPETSGTSVGLAPTPQRMQDTIARTGSMGSRGVSPREGGAVQAGGMRQGGGPLSRPGRVSSSSIGASRVSSASTFEAAGQQGGNNINIYAPLDPPMARSQSGRQSHTQSQFQSQQQQQPQVVTAVDLARRQSMARRASSNGLQQGAGDLGGSGGWGSSTGRVSSSSVGYNGQSSNGYGAGAGLAAGRQSQQQQPWGQQGTNMHSAGIYGTIRREQWQQRQQYRL